MKENDNRAEPAVIEGRMGKSFTHKLIGSFSVPCLQLGLLFFAASLTPSLIPRGPDVQGIPGGLVTALGYLVGQVIALLWRAAEMPCLSGRPAARLTWFASAVVLALFLWILGSSLTWQNDLREKMGMEPAESLRLAQVMVLAIVTFSIAFGLGRLEPVC